MPPQIQSVPTGATMDFTRHLLPNYVTFTRASSATWFDANGTLRTAINDQPRFDFDPFSLQTLGFLIEGARTNAQLNSNTFSAATFTKIRSSVTGSSGTSPDGTNNAWLFTEDTTAAATHVMDFTNSFVAGTRYTKSLFIKVGTSGTRNIRLALPSAAFGTFTTAIFNPSTGALEVSTGVADRVTTSQALGNGWYRVSLAATATTTAAGVCNINLMSGTTVAYTGDGVSNVLIFGAQLEEGGFASSYISTTAAAATRAEDTATSNNAELINAKTFVVQFQLRALPPSGFPATIFQLDSGADTAATRVSVDVSSVGTVTLSGGTGTANLGTYTAGTVGRVVVSFDGSNIYGSLNSAATVSASSTQASSFTTFRFGRVAAGTAHLFGWLRTAACYPATTTNPAAL